ncbi:hypothetical protein NJI34_37760 [Pseudomonas sp. S 311-6]|nr:hypothetical protein [Pseudomonas sp. S 311-6]
MSTKASTKAKRGMHGVCALTGKEGKFVKSHILPRALTLISRNGDKVREAEIGGIPRRRPPTWYDDQLVIRGGEDILESIDTPAIETLRSHKLIWSAFPKDGSIPDLGVRQIHESLGMRSLVFSDSEIENLRLFFLSIVWRAAASLRPEFIHVQLEDEEKENLRQRVLSCASGDFFEYPIILDQLITRGDPHNRVPILESCEFPGEGGAESMSVDSVRIYMDGLVARVLITADEGLAKNLSIMCLGAGDETLVIARSFEKSRASDNMREVIVDNISRGYS